MKSIDKYVVVVPTHRIKHLRKNLKSILSQTVKPDLIIAIDDTDYLLNPEIKKELWGGSLWTSGFYGNTVGQYANEEIIRKYVKNQGKAYNKIYQGQLNMNM